MSHIFDVIEDKILMDNVGVCPWNIADIGANGVVLFLRRTQFHYLQGKIYRSLSQLFSIYIEHM